MNRISSQALTTAAAATVGLLGWAASAHATIIATEPFTFANGSGTILSAAGNNNDNSSQWNGTWAGIGVDGTYNAGSLSAPSSATAYNIAPSGNSVLLSDTGGSAGDSRNLNLSGTVWISLLDQPQNVSGRLQGLSLFTSTAGGGTDLLDIGSDGEANGAAPGTGFQAANQNTGIDLTPNWAINGAGTATLVNSSNATPIATNTTALLVVEYNITSGTAYLWVNPTSSTDFTNTSDTTNGPYEALSGLSTGPVASLRIFDGSNLSNYGGAISSIYDQIEIGTTYSDVLTPEPASLSLMAIPMLGLLARRRRVR